MRAAERVAKRFFPQGFTDRERAVFEAGIALGAIVHTVAGFPVSGEVKHFIERAVERSFLLQPYRRKVKLRIKPRVRKAGLYRYGTVDPEDLDVEVEVAYGEYVVAARMSYVNSLKYPLMYVSKITQRRGGSSPHPYTGIRRAKARRRA
ncbi:MAG: dihydroneopterin aldolase family protein [Candidatus Caldarchaeum sp.]|nr:dihydroneopterin aldolase family protein [Candidatus Caldarchaeum sp.]